METLISESDSQCEWLILVMNQARTDSMGRDRHDKILLDSDPVKLLLLYTHFREAAEESGRFISSEQNRIV